MQMLLLGLWAKTQKTILMVTHSISEACFMSDRVVVLSRRPAGLPVRSRSPWTDLEKDR